MVENNIAGALYGMAIGDALGMPSELWSRRRVKDFFGRIETFLDGPQENDAAKYFHVGQFTDDTSQALILLDSLFENEFIPDERIVADKLINWAYSMDAFSKNILGPSSKEALTAMNRNHDPKPYTSKALTNGAAMRIAPIGCLFEPLEKSQMKNTIVTLSQATHSTDVAFGGAAMIAAAVSAAIEGYSWAEIMTEAISIYPIASEEGYETFSASLTERLRLGMQLADQFKNDEETFSQKIYDLIGAGTATSESVPAALSIAYYAKDPTRCALLSANLGGDTDTIGAMATAICGAKSGFERLDKTWVKIITENNEVPLQKYIQRMVDYRSRSKKGEED